MVSPDELPEQVETGEKVLTCLRSTMSGVLNPSLA